MRTIAKVMREFNDRGLGLPRRNRHGDLHWARATTSAVAAILKNPAYAGVFVYGRTRLRKPSDAKLPTKVPKPIEQWRIIVKDRYPPYIGWQRTRRLGALSATTEQNTCAKDQGCST
ncbi:recombinase family protein [Bradyrhizobium brasilense]|uniref:recombinase family protein n=1 Tax=Bradyrhizobium brasilense TaxID=1419277 RepID=UPI0024B0A265|nr:recombinase family protein [Bradyrhizobium australafricanum]WFU31378.1 recombinase family protein [Bradyrhizobium australafricanum]